MADTKDYLERIPNGGIPTESLKEHVEAPRDYAGAQAKIDPEEIRMVRKLDCRIMVRYCLPAGLIYPRKEIMK